MSFIKNTLGGLTIIGVMGGVTGMVIFNKEQGPNYLMATLSTDHTTGTTIPDKLYENDQKNFKCKLTYPAIQSDGSEIIAEDEECEIYSMTNSEKPPELSSIQPSKDKITEKASLVKSTGSQDNYYQITLSKETWTKFTSSHYQNIKIELVPKTAEGSSSTHITFNSHFGFKGSEIQGKIQYVVIQASNKKTTNREGDSSPDQSNFTYDSEEGYQLTKLNNGSSQGIQDSRTIQNTHVNPIEGSNNLKFSEIANGNYYILKTPDNKMFDLKDLMNKKIDLNCVTTSCSGSFTAKMVKFIIHTSDPKTFSVWS